MEEEVGSRELKQCVHRGVYPVACEPIGVGCHGTEEIRNEREGDGLCLRRRGHGALMGNGNQMENHPVRHRTLAVGVGRGVRACQVFRVRQKLEGRWAGTGGEAASDTMSSDRNDDNGIMNGGADTPNSLPSLILPTVSVAIGKGIRVGDFIKPDPHDCRARQRRHILTELREWLTHRVYGSARLASHTDMSEDAIRAAMAEGRGWPGGRLWLLCQTLEEDDIPLPGTPADTDDRLRLTGEWAATLCAHWLRGETLPVTSEAAFDLALGFVTEDRLSDGRTIADLWPQPEDLDALRFAPPLPESQAEVSLLPRSMDEQLDDVGAFVGKFLAKDMELRCNVKMPGWAWSALTLTVVGYFWLVAFLLSGVAPRRVGSV